MDVMYVEHWMLCMLNTGCCGIKKNSTKRIEILENPEILTHIGSDEEI